MIELIIALMVIVAFGFFFIGYAFGYRAANLSSEPLIDRLRNEIDRNKALCRLKACGKSL